MRADIHDEQLASAWKWMTELEADIGADALNLDDEALRQALDVVERGTFRDAGTVRCVPSAGAIFPYDLAVLVRATGGAPARIFRLDLARRTAVLLPVDGAPVERQLTTVTALADIAADIIVLSRPWLSMRKYGPRGYLYAQLDAGHASTNLLGTALDRGPAEIRLRVPRDKVMAALTEALAYREVHSIVSLGRIPGAPPMPQWTTARQHAGTRTVPSRDLELFCWTNIPHRMLDSSGSPKPVVHAPIVGPAAGDPADTAISRGRWQTLAHRRRSCKQFATVPPAAENVAAMMGALTTPLPIDIPRATQDGLRITLVGVPGPLTDACRAVAGDVGFEVVTTGALADHDMIRRACMGQQHLATAPAFVLCHLRRDVLLAGADGQTLRDAVFRASAVIQLLYLGAARSGVAVTAVGGLDVAAWRRIGGLAADEELLYLLALGQDRDGVPKYDRAELAYAHGE